MNVDHPGARWFKSSHSDADYECVEVAFLDQHMIGVRDSKNPAGGALVFGPDEWDAFTAGVAGGKFNHR